jgi:hypothetical protein
MTGWRRSRCCRSGSCWRGPAGDALGAANVLLGGAAIACIAFAIGQLPRETRLLERLDGRPPVPVAGAGPRPPV